MDARGAFPSVRHERRMAAAKAVAAAEVADLRAEVDALRETTAAALALCSAVTGHQDDLAVIVRALRESEAPR